MPIYDESSACQIMVQIENGWTHMMKSTMENLAQQDVNGAQVEELVGHNSRYICHWSWLSVNSCAWKSSISTMAEFSNSCQDGKNVSVCSGIMFKNNDIWNRMSYAEVVLASLFKCYYIGNLIYYPSHL